MTDDKINTIGLSRRRVLGGIGAIGIASAGAGIGTTAYFSDQQSFENNTITAGTFALTVEQSIQHLDQDDMGPDQDAYENGADGDGIWVQSPIDIEDAKPGDEYKFCWDITVDDNPGYVVVVGDSSEMNGVQAENVSLSDLWDIDDMDDLSTIGESATAALTTTVGGDDYSVQYSSLASLLASLESGIIVSDDSGNAVTFQPGETVTVCLEITIPTDVGNEIQGAVLTSSMTFYAEQARHNDPAGVLAAAMDD
ncbi:SipW-dependent-type signal peptide-containing protein [Natronosalvus amylolyticus]|uniref:SipW-dependent-type signal peptide-containing protein n=1 Tax=Natronosalvus amylolyticus TaxID=2961994 RepID=UPI0020C9FB5A|nr:SipW-dependent-type signal peptide-containing protein [Natronosalvus amylolyticus]